MYRKKDLRTNVFRQEAFFNVQKKMTQFLYKTKKPDYKHFTTRLASYLD